MTHHLVGVAEIAKLLGVTRQRVHQLAREEGFPAPAAELTAGKVWETAAVERWARERRLGRDPSGHDGGTGGREAPGDDGKR